MHGPQVVLHVGADVWVGRAEGRVARRDGGGREAYEGDVRDDGASCQTCGAGREWKERKKDMRPALFQKDSSPSHQLIDQPISSGLKMEIEFSLPSSVVAGNRLV